MVKDMGRESLFLHFLFVALVSMSFMGFGRAGDGITSSFIRSEYPSEDMPLNSSAFAVPKGYNAPQQVHIIQGDYNGTAVIISWVTPDEPGSRRLLYGTSGKAFTIICEEPVERYTLYNYTSGYIHQCLLDGLEYDTDYFYVIEEEKSARKFSFRTPPPLDPDAPYTFGIIGDLGQTYNSLSTLDNYMRNIGQAVLFVGDLSYADKYQYDMVGIRWDTWGRFVEKSAAYQPWFWSVGNHEIEYFPYMGEVTTFKSYQYRYPTPYAATNSSSPLWYAVRRASAHIIVLCSYCPYAVYTPQWIWLFEEFKRVDRNVTPWLIVIMHVPMYNSNDAHYKEGESMRVVFEEWLVGNKVDLVLAGHVHAYERSNRYSNIRYNVTSGYPYPVPDKWAPIYMTIGDGGNKEGLAGDYIDPQPDYSAFREASYGYSMLDIKNKTHALYQWIRNDNGTDEVIVDSIVIFNQHWKREDLKRNHRLHSVVSNEPLNV